MSTATIQTEAARLAQEAFHRALTGQELKQACVQVARRLHTDVVELHHAAQAIYNRRYS